MPELRLFSLFLKPLNALGLRYMVTGAVATILYGEPRLTHDLDLVLEMDAEDAQSFAEAFPLDTFYCPPVETIKVEALRRLRGHFNLVHHDTGFKADIYIKGEDKLHEWAMQRRMRFEIKGEVLWAAPIEYVILRKLEYFREGGSEKHLRDIAGILRASSELIDLPEINYWLERLGLTKDWQKALEETRSH